MSDITNDAVMQQVEASDQFCEIGKKAVKLHLLGYSAKDIAVLLNEDEAKIRDTIQKMKTIVKM